jgi:hypothetical protein
MLEDQLLDTWNIHNRINLYLLDAIEQEALRGVSASKGCAAFQLQRAGAWGSSLLTFTTSASHGWNLPPLIYSSHR